LYNNVHRHSGIGLMPPEAMHYGRAEALTQQRTSTLQSAFFANPLRFKGIEPHPPAVPTAAWINPPKEAASTLPHPSSAR
jgi:putative transposase